MSVFYCDDDLDDIELFKMAIRRIDPLIHVIATTDCEDGLTTLFKSEQLPQLIFFDILMPKMDGIEAVIAVKRNKKFNSVPIIMLSNGLSKAQIEQFNALGVFQFISKTNYIGLEQSLRGVLSLRASNQS
jgi:CheY-like chemotaxis protein